MYGRILRQLRESRGPSEADVARAVSISAAHLGRLELEQRGSYLKDFVSIAEELGEKPGILPPNDSGAMSQLNPLIDRLAGVSPDLLPQVRAILARVAMLAGSVGVAAPATTRLRPGGRR